MPSIKLANIAAGVDNALDGLVFEDIEEPGALVTLYATTPTAGGLVSYAIGTERFLVNAAVNIESSADVVDTNRDMVLDREAVPPGKQFLATTAQIINAHVVIEPLPV